MQVRQVPATTPPAQGLGLGKPRTGGPHTRERILGIGTRHDNLKSGNNRRLLELFCNMSRLSRTLVKLVTAQRWRWRKVCP
jgi:hypothetical protein